MITLFLLRCTMLYHDKLFCAVPYNTTLTLICYTVLCHMSSCHVTPCLYTAARRPHLWGGGCVSSPPHQLRTADRTLQSDSADGTTHRPHWRWLHTYTIHLNQPSHFLPHLLPHQLLIFLYINYSSSSSPTSSTHIVTSYTLRLPRASPLGQQRRGTQHIRPDTHHRCVDRSQYNRSNKVTHFTILLPSRSRTSLHTFNFTTIILL